MKISIRSASSIPVQLLLFAVMAAGARSARAENGVRADRILLGATSALSESTAAVSAKAANYGAQLYLNRINSQGGVNGRKIEVKIEDDGYEPRRAIESATKLIQQDNVFCLFQDFGSAPAKAVMQLVEKLDVPMIAPIVSAEEVRVPTRRNVFTVRASSAIEVREALHYAQSKLEAKNIGLIYQDDANGSGVRLAAMSTLHEKGAKLGFDGVIRRNSENIDVIVDKLIASKVDTVLLGLQVKPAAAIIDKAAERGFKPTYIGSSTHASNEFLSLVRSGAPRLYAAFGMPIAVPGSPYEVVKLYLQDVKAAGGEVDQKSVEGYLDAMVMVEGLRRAGRDPTRDSLRKGLEALGDATIGGVKISYSSQSHRGSSSVFFGVLKNGAYVPAQ